MITMNYNSFMNPLNVYIHYSNHVSSQPIARIHKSKFSKPFPHCPLSMPPLIVNHFQTMGSKRKD